MNNKGFTLLEILATIALLGVLVSIAIPSVIYVSNKVKEKTYNTQKDLILLAAEEYASGENYKLFNQNDCVIINTKTLLDEGYYELKDEIITPEKNENIKDLPIYLKTQNNKYKTKIVEDTNDSQNCNDLKTN